MSDTNGSGRGFGYWLNIFANLAVVAGIVFLAVELRQNSTMMRAQVRNEITQNVFNATDRTLHPDVIAARMRILNGEEPLPRDAYVLNAVTRGVFRILENTDYQYRLGLFDESENQANLVFVEAYVRDSSRVEWWRQNREQFSESFRGIIDSLIADQP
jgi:hypothetical protein